MVNKEEKWPVYAIRETPRGGFFRGLMVGLLLFGLVSTPLLLYAPPPPPPSNHNLSGSSSSSNGGGAPIDDGLIVLMVCSLGYLGLRVYGEKMRL